MKKTLFVSALLGAGLWFNQASAGTVNYANGNPGDWKDSNNGNPIAVTTFNIHGPTGAGYTEINNLHPGQDDGAYNFYGASGYNTSPMNSLSQSIAVYLDPTAVSEQSGGFWLDMTPDATVANSIYGTPQLWGAENNFRLSGSASGLTVKANGSSSAFATITSAGWYEFQIIWSRDLLGTDPVTAALSVTELSTATTVGSTTTTASGSDPTTYESDYLGGSGYVWLTMWSDGFAGNTLNVAEESTNGVPDTGSTILLLGLGFLGLIAFGFRQNRLQVAQ